MNVTTNNGVNSAVNSGLQSAQRAISKIDEKVCKAVRKLFKILKQLILFPTRFIGGKDFSIAGLMFRLPKELIISLFKKNTLTKNQLFGEGYHRSQEKTLTSKESVQFVKYAAVSTAQHNLKEDDWIKPTNFELYIVRNGNFDVSKLPGKILISEKCFYDETTGLKASISFNDNEVIVGFGAVTCLDHLYENLPAAEKKLKIASAAKIQDFGARTNILGARPKYYRQADALFQIIKSHPDFKNKEFSLTGQCYGGSVAQYVAIKNQHQAVCFNTLPLGAGLQEALGSKLLSQADKYVTHVCATTDMVSDNGLIALFDRPLSLMGIRTPGNFGRRFVIPSAFKDGFGTHCLLAGSLFQHIGYDKGAKLFDLSAADMAVAQNARAASFQVEV